MRKRKNRLSLYITVQPHEQGRLPDYDLYGSQHRNLDSISLTPSTALIQERNCKTINRLLPALARIAVNKTRLAV